MCVICRVMTHPCKWAAVGDASCQGSQPAVPLPFHEDLSHMWEVNCYTYLPCVGSSEVDPVPVTHSCVSLACLLRNTTTPPLATRNSTAPVYCLLWQTHFLPNIIIYSSSLHKVVFKKWLAEASLRGVVKTPTSTWCRWRKNLRHPILPVYL